MHWKLCRVPGIYYLMQKCRAQTKGLIVLFSLPVVALDPGGHTDVLKWRVGSCGGVGRAGWSLCGSNFCCQAAVFLLFCPKLQHSCFSLLMPQLDRNGVSLQLEVRGPIFSLVDRGKNTSLEVTIKLYLECFPLSLVRICQRFPDTE